jgi:hypothetical protein
MKNLTALIALLLAFTSATAQSIATKVNFNSGDRPALMLAVPYDQDIAEGAIVENLKKTGYDAETKGKLFWKQNKMHGYYTFKGVTLNKQLVDLYFRVESNGRKKENSVIYLIVGKTEEFYVSEETDETTYQAARKFLNNFLSETAAFKLSKDIEDQEEELKLAQKKHAKLIDHEKELKKKIEDLEEDLKSNRNQQENQQKVVAKEEKKLGELKEKMKEM